MGGANGLRCLVKFYGITIRAVSMAMYRSPQRARYATLVPGEANGSATHAVVPNHSFMSV